MHKRLNVNTTTIYVSERISLTNVTALWALEGLSTYTGRF